MVLREAYVVLDIKVVSAACVDIGTTPALSLPPKKRKLNPDLAALGSLGLQKCFVSHCLLVKTVELKIPHLCAWVIRMGGGCMEVDGLGYFLCGLGFESSLCCLLILGPEALVSRFLCLLHRAKAPCLHPLLSRRDICR